MILISALLSLTLAAAAANAAETRCAHKNAAGTVIKAPTCEAEGTEELVCPDCGETWTQAVAPLGHEYGEWAELTPATWRTEGERGRTCSYCEAAETEAIHVLTHLPAAECPAGDVDMNGNVTAEDARLALRLAVDFDDGLDDTQQTQADFDETGDVTAEDARCILRVSVDLDPFASAPEEPTEPEKPEPDTQPQKPGEADGYTFVRYTDKGFALVKKNGVTYVATPHGYTLIANKTYALPSDYAPGDLTPECKAAFNELTNAAAKEGLSMYVVSGYRSYWLQSDLYSRYCAQDGKAAADTYSARPGHSEHQSGLAMDVNSLYGSFAYTAEGKWLAANAWKYGFIIRYPADKQSVTGYIYEPWHIRYLGKPLAAEVYASGLCLEEYFGITSSYS